MDSTLCKGNCGKKVTYKGWCKIKWKSDNKFVPACPIIEEKRGGSISKFRIEEAKKGKNPMQNPIICAKNHSKERNTRASETLKKLGKQGLLPQQIESKELKERRRKNISLTHKKLLEAGKHPRQLESHEKRKERIGKIANTLKQIAKEGRLPIQNMSQEQKKILGRKISKILREKIRKGETKLSRSWKRVPYRDLILRSNWEKAVAEFLDRHGFDWEYETLRIAYWDTERKVEATTVPDFYIPSINTVIEVKSNADFSSQKTRDKLKGIKKQGFKAVLVGRKEIRWVKNNEKNFLNHMGVKINEKS